MCFVLSCAIYFSAIALAGWLSVYRITSFFCSNVNPNSTQGLYHPYYFLLQREPQLRQELYRPYYFLYSSRHRHVLSFSRWECDSRLTFTTPTNHTCPPFTHIIYPVVDLRVSIHPPHSLSKYPLTSIPILKSMAGISQHSWILFLPCNCNSCSTLVLVHHWLIVSR